MPASYGRWLVVALFFLCLAASVNAADMEKAEHFGGAPAGSPSRGEVLWFDDLESGAPGWTHGDNTALPPNFHRDTYMAYAGSYSWWCGNFDYDSNGGYGNRWDESLLVPDFDVGLFTGIPMLTFDYRTDCEVGFDFAYLEMVQGGDYTTSATFNGKTPWSPSLIYSLAAADNPIKVRFRFVSDVAWSDQDGLYQSIGGGFMCDNIRVYDYITGTEVTLFLDTAEVGCTDSCIPTRTITASGDYWHLGTSDCHSLSSDSYWACTSVDTPGYVSPNVSNWLMTPMIDISEVTAEQGLRFVYHQQFFVPHEQGDSYKKEFTVDGGATWVTVGNYWGDQYELYGYGPCRYGSYVQDLTAYLPGTQAAMRWTMTTDAAGCGPDAIGLAGLMFDDVWLETMESVNQVWHVPGVIPTIQEAIDIASGGDTVVVEPGTYDETLEIPASFSGCTLVGAGGARAYTYVTGGVTLADGLTGFTMSNLYITGVGASNSIIRALGTVTDLTIDGCVIDGENVSGRLGYSGGQLEGDVTVTACEMKGVLGWALFDSKSGSGGDGSAMGTVTFADNYIHNCNGSIVFRGLSTDRTDVVHCYGNVIESIGGNAGEQGQHWAGFEANRAVEANVYNNVVEGVLEGQWGEGQALQLWDIDTLNCHHNIIKNNFQGLYIYGGSGAFAVPGGAVEYNSFTGNTDYGISVDPTATGGPLDAELNWWGHASGPSTSKGTGDKALGSIDYDPWMGTTGGENIVCDPDYDELSIADPATTIDVNYLGGGGGRVFGYTVTLSWNGSYVTTTPGSITEGDLLSSIDNTFWYARTTGTDEITIDCIILGTQPGAWGPGTMFSIDFTAVAAVPYGVSPVDIAIDRVRDEYNNELFGFFEDDGEIVVDTVAPLISSVHISNFGLLHTDDYIKNGDQAGVDAIVTDAYPGFDRTNITADLSGLGDAPRIADAYTSPNASWLLFAPATCTPLNGVVTVAVTATDAHGNSSNLSDTIIADNTPPTAVTGFDASPGHERCDLIWAHGTDLYYDGVVVQRAEVGGEYPQYLWLVANWTGGVDSAYPASQTVGTNVYNGTGTSHTDVVTARNIYYYQAFSYDIARNYGPAATTARDLATNYWLGDITDEWGAWLGYDGLVDDGDLLQLSGAYWTSNPTTYPGDAECDVGPTVHPDWSRVGLPKPDNQVEFEDAMIFAMNYGVVAPRVVPFMPKPYDPAPLALALGGSEGRGDEVEIALCLEGNSDEVKGLSASVTYDGSELEFVSARLSSQMVSPLGEVFFMHRDDGERVDLDAVVLGTGVTIGGSGEVAVLTFLQLSNSYSLEVSDARLRDADNGELSVKLGGYESGGDLPLAFRLVGNTPNPFNPVTKVAYHVPFESEVTIRVYDVAGRCVSTLVDGMVEAGRHEAVWTGLNDSGDAVGSGVYFCTMEAPDFHESRKMTLLK